MCKLEPKWNTWIDNHVYKFSLPLSWTSLGNFPLLAIWLPSTTAYSEVMHRKSIKANLKTTLWGIFPIPLFLIIPHISENYIMYLYNNFLLGIDQLSFPYRSLGDCWLWNSQCLLPNCIPPKTSRLDFSLLTFFSDDIAQVMFHDRGFKGFNRLYNMWVRFFDWLEILQSSQAIWLVLLLEQWSVCWWLLIQDNLVVRN